MKTKARQQVNPQLGMDLSIPAPPNTAQLLQNWAYDAQTRGWTNQVGYEQFFQDDENGPFGPIGLLTKPVDSIYVFQKHSGKKQDILFECNGRLVVLEPWTTNKRNVLSSNRTIPAPNAPRTCYEPYGRYCVITNGIDEPIKYRGDGRLYPLGWGEAPGDPIVRSIRDPEAAGDLTALEAADDYVGSGNNIWQGDDSYFEGVSSSDSDTTVEYIYRVSFVNENGSESPLSNDSNKLTYTGTSVNRNGNSGVPKVCAVIEIPQGPTGTVARRIYRTKSDGQRSLFYFVEEVKNNHDELYVDYRSDASLGSEAPQRTFSVPFPSKGCRFTAAFKNCLFVDGGEMEPTRLYYSAALEPDRFPAFNYFEVGTREGGDITGLEAYYNSLLVFRENGIDLIRGDAVNGFELIPFVEGIGAYSHNSIVAIPSIGVAFLSRDGVYLLTGGLDGGSDLTLQKISKGIDEIFERTSIDAMPAAVGAYSSKHQELHFYIPTSGRPRLQQGLVYHTNNGQWTQRNGFPVRCITVDKDANLLFGADDYSPLGTGSTGDKITRGIYVISNKPFEGSEIALGDDAIQNGAPITSEFRSQWIDMGLPYLKKYPKYLYVYCLSNGDPDVSINHYRNRNWNDAYEGGGVKPQVADEKDQPVYDKALWGTPQWQDKRLIQVRCPITTGACSEYAFKIEANNPFLLIGYSVEYNVDGSMTITGKS